jgi:hypothetical protein
MSRKHRRQDQKKSFPWPVVALGAILVIAAAFLFANRGGGDSGGKITVDQQKIDYGYVPFGNDKSFKIKVTNTGVGALSFKKNPYVEVLEGC